MNFSLEQSTNCPISDRLKERGSTGCLKNYYAANPRGP